MAQGSVKLTWITGYNCCGRLCAFVEMGTYETRNGKERNGISWGMRQLNLLTKPPFMVYFTFPNSTAF